MAEPIEFDIGAHTYRAYKLTVFQQLHVQRKIAPLLPPLIPLAGEVLKRVPLSDIKAGKVSPGALTSVLPQIVPILQAFADSIGTLPDEPLEYVIATCLSVVKRKQGDVWAPVWNAQAKSSMFEDLNDIASVVRIVIRVVIDSLGPFIRGLVTSQDETENKPSQA